jgi:hypothetical protein
MTTASIALMDLRHALDDPPPDGTALGMWRWTVRKRMADVRDVLLAEGSHGDDGWLAARGGSILRERNALLRRLGALGAPILESSDVERVRGDLQRLVTDVAHHVQRLHDLAYDEVELELGGSE